MADCDRKFLIPYRSMNFFLASLNILSKYIYRNRRILSDLSRPAKKNCVNLHWWSPAGPEENVGDYLSPIVVDFVKARLQISEPDGIGKTKHLFAIGSIIDGGYQDATVWGSGILSGNRKFWWRKIRKLDIRAVRGPETRRTLIENGIPCPEVYGDPAILLPLFYTPVSAKKEYKYRVIQNHALEQATENALSPVTDNWKGFIDEIVKSELVISSSLHGIILAEAYGVPAIMLGTRLDMFKFRDYYYATGRYEFPVAKSVEDALNTQPAALPDLKKLQRNLLESFPADLWKNNSLL